MNATVPLWAFVALGLAAPTVALVGVLITTRAETRRSHRNWLRQTKYESYEDLFSTFLAMKAAYSDYLDAEVVTSDAIERLSITAEAFKHQFDRTRLIASLRVSFYMEMELLPLWFNIAFQLEAATEGSPPHQVGLAWGGYSQTQRAAAYDLGVRRDPGGWLARWRDRGNVVPSGYVDRFVADAEVEPVMTFEVSNPYIQADQPPGHPDSPSSGEANPAPR